MLELVSYTLISMGVIYLALRILVAIPARLVAWFFTKFIPFLFLGRPKKWAKDFKKHCKKEA